MSTGSYLSIITLNASGLNAPTKRQRLAEWIKKQDPYICCLQETHLKPRHIQTESEAAQLCRLLATPWTAAYQAPPSMGFARQEYWSGLPLPSLQWDHTYQ